MAIPRSHCRCLARRLCAPVRLGPARAQAAGPARRGTSGLRALQRSRFMDAPSNEKKEIKRGPFTRILSRGPHKGQTWLLAAPPGQRDLQRVKRLRCGRGRHPLQELRALGLCERARVSVSVRVREWRRRYTWVSV